MKKIISILSILVISNASFADNLDCSITDNNNDLPNITQPDVMSVLSTGEKLSVSIIPVGSTKQILIQKFNKRGYPLLRAAGENVATLDVENPDSGVELYVRCTLK